MSSLIPFYQKLDVDFIRGEGCYLWDEAGIRYLDLTSGIGVNNLGFSHIELNNEIRAQIKNYIHLSNLFKNSWSEKLSDQLVKITQLHASFFVIQEQKPMKLQLKLQSYMPMKKI